MGEFHKPKETDIYEIKNKNCTASTCKAIIYWEKLFHFKNQGAPKSLNFPPLSLQLITKLRLQTVVLEGGEQFMHRFKDSMYLERENNL